jgi:hypothetical protein
VNLLPRGGVLKLIFLHSSPAFFFSFGPQLGADPAGLVHSLYLCNDPQIFQSFENAEKGSFMHDANIEGSLVFDDVGSELAFPHASIPMQVIEHFNVTVEFERSALPFGLFYS